MGRKAGKRGRFDSFSVLSRYQKEVDDLKANSPFSYGIPPSRERRSSVNLPIWDYTVPCNMKSFVFM